MKNSGIRWRFINQSNSQESIVVHDEISARNLVSLLQKMGSEDDWVMQEERPLGALFPKNEPKSEPKPTPVAESPAVASAKEAISNEFPAEVPSEQISLQSAESLPAESLPADSPPVEEPLAPEEKTAPIFELDRAPEPSASRPEPLTVAPEPLAPQSAVPAPSLQVVAPETQAVVMPQRSVTPPPPPKKAEKKERRSTPRHLTEFRVILISGSSSFRTMSQDVSLGGMRLKKTIPSSFLEQKCIAYVSHKDLSENIEIVCHVIGDPQDPCRIQFIQPNPVQLRRLSDWLLEHQKNRPSRRVAS